MSSAPEELVASEVEHAARPRLRFHRYTIISAAATVVSMGLALIEEYIRNNNNIPYNSITWIVLLHVAAFLAVELAILISLVGQLEWVVFEKALQVEGLIQQSNSQRHLMNHLTRIFSYANERAHGSVQQAIIRLIDDIETDGNKIEIKGGFLSLLVYECFWKTLVEAQRDRPKRMKALTTYAIHTASVELWGANEYYALRTLQEDFMLHHGTIFRIFLHHAKSDIPLEKFAEVIGNMQNQGINAFYLDVRSNADDEIALHSDDCLFAKIDREAYASVAHLFWHKNKSAILDSSIELGDEAFESHRKQWLKLVDRLDPHKHPPPQFDPKLQPLAKRPDDIMLEKMKSLS